MRRALSASVLAFALAHTAAAGQVAGMVVAANGGEPLASVELTLSPVAAAQDERRPQPLRGLGGAAARSGLDGRFVFRDVAPGEYLVGASKAGYEGGSRIARRVTVTDSEPSASVSIEMRRSAAIEGRVVDGDGDPLPDVRVELRAWTMTDTRRMLRGMRSAQTDDRGQYRLSNVPPGSYLIYLHPSTLGMRQGGLLYESAGAYYPSGVTPAEASKLDIDWDSELQGVDFTAPPPADTLASGSVLREDGTPCPECSIVILDGEGLPAASTRMAETGRFAVHGLSTGEYSFIARGPRGAGSAVEKAYLPEKRPVEIGLRLAPGQKISGFLSTENVQDGEEISLERAMLRLLPLDVTLGGQPSGARIEADGTFEVEQAPQGLYQPLVFGLPSGGYLSRILYGGASLPPAGLRVTADGPVTGLELVASFDGAVVRGQAVDATRKSPAPPDGLVVLLPQRTEAASSLPSMGTYRGENLEFQFNGVAPGEYLLFCVPRNFAWDWSDPALLAELRRRAERVEVRPRETAEAQAPFLPGP